MVEKDNLEKKNKHEDQIPVFDDRISKLIVEGSLSYDEEEIRQAVEWFEKAVEDAKK